MKAPLSDLELAAKKHQYKFGGEPLPSVTRITGLVDDQKSMRMVGAAVKITKAGGDHRAEWKAKTERGTRVHGHLERWLDGQTIDVLPADAGFMDAGEKYLLDNPHDWLYAERMIVGDGWGGRFDVIGQEPNGRVVLLDWKSGSPYDEHLMQLGAYVNGLGFATYDDDGNFMGIEPMPYIHGAGCVYLHEDGSYEAPEYTRAELDEAYDAFCGLLGVHTWLQKRKAA